MPRRFQAILEAGYVDGEVTRSELEDRFLAFVDRVGIERPELNVPLHVDGRWIEVDCVWRNQRLIVELDGRGAHATALAFEQDRARDRALVAAGWRVVRITWRELHEHPGGLERELLALLE